MAKHETFNAFMTAVVAYAPLVGVIAYFTGGHFGILFSGLFTVGFWLFVVGYFVWDYSKGTKKAKPKPMFPPLSSDVKVEENSKKEITKIRKILNWATFILEIFEASAFILLPPLVWQVYEINGVLVLTYSNLVLIGLFGFGLFMCVDVARRIHNPKKILEYW